MSQTLVSQDVSLFSGSIRSNLDPFDEHTDAECYDVLEASHLKPLLDRSLASDHVGNGSALDVQITANSMSAGEKQLLALARAILRRTNIVILDEATAQVDQDLDDKVSVIIFCNAPLILLIYLAQIQQTIRKDLSHATVIAIAHRLKTVLDYDRVLVLDQGQIREFDTPLKLLRRPGSLFGELCRKSADWPVLRAMAERRSE
jgi:ABC-type multidrug transport system fused ATPase/permease subunit